MKFLHLSTGDTRGAFSGAFRLHSALKHAGHESKMIVGAKGTNDPDVIGPALAIAKLRSLLVKTTNQLMKMAFGRANNNRHIFKLNLPYLPVGLQVQKIKNFRPDLIIVYYTADFISHTQIEYIWRKLGRPRLVFYMMDMAPLTASCHYAWKCDGYYSGCVKCPMTVHSFIKYAVRREGKKKDNLYRTAMPIMVAGSEMLNQQRSLSSLARGLKAEKILIGIDPERFTPISSSQARALLSIDHQGQLIYFGAQHVTDERKGFTYLVDALFALKNKLTAQQAANVALLVIGDSNIAAKSGFRTFNLPYLSDPVLFSASYSAADIYVCPSVEDSGPMMINESLMCGTPVVAFERGVALDLVREGETGSLARELSSKSLAYAINRLLLLTPEKMATMRQECRNVALSRTSTASQVGSFISLTKAAINVKWNQ